MIDHPYVIGSYIPENVWTIWTHSSPAVSCTRALNPIATPLACMKSTLWTSYCFCFPEGGDHTGKFLKRLPIHLDLLSFGLYNTHIRMFSKSIVFFVYVWSSPLMQEPFRPSLLNLCHFRKEKKLKKKNQLVCHISCSNQTFDGSLVYKGEKAHITVDDREEWRGFPKTRPDALWAQCDVEVVCGE